MEFKDMYVQIEMSLAKKIEELCPKEEDINKFAYQTYSDAMAHVEKAVPNMDIPQKAVFIGKALALNSIDYLKSGHTPEEIQRALTEIAQTFTGAFVDLAFKMYGSREDQLRALAQEKQEAGKGKTGKQPASASSPAGASVVDISNIKSRIR